MYICIYIYMCVCGFPKIGIPPVIIYLDWRPSRTSTVQRFGGTPVFRAGNLHISLHSIETCW